GALEPHQNCAQRTRGRRRLPRSFLSRSPGPACANVTRDAGLERARALADLGALLRRRNRRTEARELLREALDTASRAGARPLAEQAETELRATGARPRRVVLSGLDSLTASERRIAEHASHGLTNREIAQTLFVTARTVDRKSVV